MLLITKVLVVKIPAQQKNINPEPPLPVIHRQALSHQVKHFRPWALIVISQTPQLHAQIQPLKQVWKRSLYFPIEVESFEVLMTSTF